MKITRVAEIVNIGHVARILEAEICGAENMCAVLMYNHIRVAKLRNFCLCSSKSQPQTLIYGEK